MTEKQATSNVWFLTSGIPIVHCHNVQVNKVLLSEGFSASSTVQDGCQVTDGASFKSFSSGINFIIFMFLDYLTFWAIFKSMEELEIHSGSMKGV